MTELKDELKLLGNHGTKYPQDYDPSVLEAFSNRHPDGDYFVKFNCPEFTSLCPITGQPDYACIIISYVPDKLLVESKSLKLYLFSYRNHGDFHENVVNTVMKDLIRLLDHYYAVVTTQICRYVPLSSDLGCAAVISVCNGLHSSRILRTILETAYKYRRALNG